MKIATKIWLIAALVFLSAGIVITVIAASSVNYDVSGMFSATAEENTFQSADDFTKIDINCVSGDIELRPAEDGQLLVHYIETESLKYVVELKDSTLSIHPDASGPWYSHIHFADFNLVEENVIVYLPKSTFESVTLHTVSGNITTTQPLEVSGPVEMLTVSGDITTGQVNAHSIDCKTTSGNMSVKELQASSATFHSVSGDIRLDKCTSRGDMTVEATSGDLTLNACEVEGTLTLHTISGDISETDTTTKKKELNTVSGDHTVTNSR